MLWAVGLSFLSVGEHNRCMVWGEVWADLLRNTSKILEKIISLFFLKDCEIKEEGKKHFLTLYNVRLDQAGGVDFQAANAKSGAHLRVKRKYLWNTYECMNVLCTQNFFSMSGQICIL